MAPITATTDGKRLARCLGEVIREHRKNIRMSQELLAEKSDLHRTQIGFLERGERIPNIQTLHRIAVALEIDLSSLIKEAGF